MSGHEITDPLSTQLASLRDIPARSSHDDRVVRRCHDALADLRRTRASSRTFRFVDLLMAAGAAVYVLAALVEGVQILIIAAH